MDLMCSGGGIPTDALVRQHQEITSRLSRYHPINSVFEVGCGCGAELYLFSNDGYKIGGVDYSSAQIEIAENILAFKHGVVELFCDEAANIPTDIKYDSVFSNSVFSYFPDADYATEVLDRMREKTRFSIGLIDVHDIEKKEEFEQYRRATVENYEERYKNLKKFFYSRNFFQTWADKNGLEIEFYESNVAGYWNSKFVFDVYLYKR